jgi:hypothetical protein
MSVLGTEVSSDDGAPADMPAWDRLSDTQMGYSDSAVAAGESKSEAATPGAGDRKAAVRASWSVTPSQEPRMSPHLIDREGAYLDHLGSAQAPSGPERRSLTRQ